MSSEVDVLSDWQLQRRQSKDAEIKTWGFLKLNFTRTLSLNYCAQWAKNLQTNVMSIAIAT
jgi:hypothetical protein